MQYNKNPISLREGHALIDGVEVMDGVKMTINFTPETWTGRQLNETTPSTRWVGATITGSMTRRRTNNWLKTKIKEYQATKATPEFVIQGIMDDANSDYYAAHGSDVVTCVGCVLTGDLPLTALDAESGSVVDDVINFNISGLFKALCRLFAIAALHLSQKRPLVIGLPQCSHNTPSKEASERISLSSFTHCLICFTETSIE